jgi:hypothetical protein
MVVAQWTVALAIDALATNGILVSGMSHLRVGRRCCLARGYGPVGGPSSVPALDFG